MFLDGDGAEVDWIVGYGPPPEKFQEKLTRIVAGGETFKDLKAAFAKNPKDAAAAFKLARKYADRFDNAKTMELYKEVVALDPDGKAGSYTNEYTKVTVPYTEFAALQVAFQNAGGIAGAAPTEKPIRDFLAKYPKSPLTKDAYSRMAGYYGRSGTKEEAEPFFEEYAAKFPEDPTILDQWLARIIKDKGPYEKGAELAEKIQKARRGLTLSDPNQNVAALYLLKGDKEKALDIYGESFMENQVTTLAYNLIGCANFWIDKDQNKESALAMAEKALAMQPDKYDFKWQVASIYFRLKMDDKALAIFGPTYIKTIDKDANALSSYASFWSNRGKNLESALAAAQKVVELKPTLHHSWATLSGVQEKLGNTAEAVKALEKAMELAPQFADNYKKRLEKLKADAAKK
jgi:tetratricopeptide (TPR) repeat protein